MQIILCHTNSRHSSTCNKLLQVNYMKDHILEQQRKTDMIEDMIDHHTVVRHNLNYCV